MAPHTYGEILARNIRAARGRADIGQDSVAARMRALGYDAWIRQTVSSTERGRRRPTAEEIFALSLVLNTSVMALMEPAAEDEAVDLPSGSVLPWQWAKATVVLRGGLHMKWEGDEPVFPDAPRSTRLPERDRERILEMDDWIARATKAVGPWPGDETESLGEIAAQVDPGGG